jgi:hypothetical protein
MEGRADPVAGARDLTQRLGSANPWGRTAFNRTDNIQAVQGRKLAATALTLLNDKITRQAFARGLTLIDLRLICDDADFANPIEPSARGGAKIAQAISKFAGGATPRSSVFTDQ